jgi:uncharacterized protein (TIGR03435 family)
MKIRGFAVLVLAAAAAWGQTVAFEVASIKPASPPTPETIMSGRFHAGVNIDGARVDIGFLSLEDLMAMAYKVKQYQIAGPDWLRTQRFDIQAKLPDGATKDQAPEMLQALLAERFGLKMHRETRDHPVYALIVGKDGAKMKESPPETTPAAGSDQPDKGGISFGTGDTKVTVQQSGRGGATVSMPGGGTIKMAMGSDGNMQMQASKMSMAAFAEFLTRMADRPVLDRTELKGDYQIALDLSMADLIQTAAAMGVVGPALTGPAAGRGPADAASDPAGGSIFQSVQKMGLKLDPRKEPTDTIVVDHIEKNPTEN